MTIIKITECDLNNDYFHFTNRENVESIIENGLIAQVGIASKMVNDRANVSVSKGGKGIMGIIGSFVYTFENTRICDIPNEYRRYFEEVTNFSSIANCSKNMACKAMVRKLKSEQYLRVEITDEEYSQAKIGGFSGYDINLPNNIDKSRISVVTGKDGEEISAFDVAQYIYEKAKDKSVFREMHKEFFRMMENEKER